MIFYFLIMRYNLTNETFLIDTKKYFPAAPNQKFSDMLFGALFYNIIPIIISLILYYPIVTFLKKSFNNKKKNLIFTGLILTLTTPIFYFVINDFNINNYYQFKAKLIAWLLCFLISTGFYFS